jgi:hypothetical protein
MYTASGYLSRRYYYATHSTLKTSSNSSTIAADSSNGLTNARCCRYSCHIHCRQQWPRNTAGCFKQQFVSQTKKLAYFYYRLLISVLPCYSHTSHVYHVCLCSTQHLIFSAHACVQLSYFTLKAFNCVIMYV